MPRWPSSWSNSSDSSADTLTRTQYYGGGYERVKVLTFINTVTFVGIATEPRSRRDDKSM